MGSRPPLLEVIGLTKRYAGVTALDSVDFRLDPGEVHVLFGENGAGKSTLISILAGANTPTAGEVRIDSEPVHFRSVRDARLKGISAVFQEFSLVPTLTVAENIFLGEELGSGPFLDKAAMRHRARALLAELDFAIDVDARVALLSRAEQQMVEIAKAFRGDLSVLILDEPTASLSGKETEQLFTTLRRLKAGGIGIIYISHRIQEFGRIADRITVLRDGKLCGSVPVAGTSEARLLELMAGRPIGDIYPTIARNPGPVVLTARGLIAPGVRGIDIVVRPGEVLGCAGLVGGGKSEVWRAILGLAPKAGGEVMLKGRDISGASTKELLRAGMFYLPPDRKAEGLQLSASAQDNILVGLLGSREVEGPGRLLSPARVRAKARQVAFEVGLDKAHLPRGVAQLSGGNQQKVLFGKAFGREFDVYIFDEPTVGVDMGTRVQIYRLIKRLAEAGKAIVVVSSDLPEILNLSHRAVVFSHGRITAELEGTRLTEAEVLKHFFISERAHA